MLTLNLSDSLRLPFPNPRLPKSDSSSSSSSSGCLSQLRRNATCHLQKENLDIMVEPSIGHSRRETQRVLKFLAVSSSVALLGTDSAFAVSQIPNVTQSPGDISSGFASAFLLVFFSELGDKTFFIAALLAARNSAATVFVGTFGALGLMTIISVVLRRTFHYVDKLLPFRFGETDLPLDDIAAVCLLNQQSSAFRFLIGALLVKYLGLPLLPHTLTRSDCEALVQRVRSKLQAWPIKHLSYAERLRLLNYVIESIIAYWCAAFILTTRKQVYFGVSTLLDAVSGEGKAEEEQKEAELAVSELSGNGAGIVAAANTIISTFALVFVAEWGDKSFFSTIALAVASSPLGVIAGALAGHGAVTLAIAYVGGILFLVFATVTVAEIVT